MERRVVDPAEKSADNVVPGDIDTSLRSIATGQLFFGRDLEFDSAAPVGSPFQLRAWDSWFRFRSAKLARIPGWRATRRRSNAPGGWSRQRENMMCIIIPCHRSFARMATLRVRRRAMAQKWLLDHEQRTASK